MPPERKTVARMTQALPVQPEVDTFIKLANRISKVWMRRLPLKVGADCPAQKRPSSKPKDPIGKGAVEARLMEEHAIGENHNE